MGKSCTLIVDRFFHSLGDDEVPNFKAYLETQSESLEPFDAFRDWKTIVESLIEGESKKS